MQTRTRLAQSQEALSIVSLSTRVQNALTASGSKQEIGPLEESSVTNAINEGRCFVLESTANRLIGCAFVKHDISEDNFPCGSGADSLPAVMQTIPKPWSFLHSVMLEPKFESQGLGVGLLDHVFTAVVQAKRARTMFLDCWDGSEKLRGFYERCGFVLVGVVPESDYRVAIYHKANDMKGPNGGLPLASKKQGLISWKRIQNSSVHAGLKQIRG